MECVERSATDARDERTVVGVVVAEGEAMPPGLARLEPDADLRLAGSSDELAAVIRDAEVLCVWDFHRPRLRDVWPEARRLRWVHAASAGVDAVVFPDLVASDVVVTNTRGVLDDAIAEWVLGVMLVFAKDLHNTLRLQHAGEWRHRESERLADRRVLVVGAGSIGRSVARLCRVAGIRVQGVASVPRTGDPDFERVVGAADLGSVLGEADFVVICAPLTAATRGLIGARELAALPPGARLINVGRGPVIDEAAVLDALRSGTLAGAALDVFDDEPLPPDHPFWTMDQVIVSPHMAGDFAGWQEAFSAVFRENFGRFTRGEQLQNVVDKSRVAAPVNAP